MNLVISRRVIGLIAFLVCVFASSGRLLSSVYGYPLNKEPVIKLDQALAIVRKIPLLKESDAYVLATNLYGTEDQSGRGYWSIILVSKGHKIYVLMDIFTLKGELTLGEDKNFQKWRFKISEGQVTDFQLGEWGEIHKPHKTEK